MPTTTVARLVCDEPTARLLADALSESLEDAVCAAFEGERGQWLLAIHFRAPPDEAALRALVQRAADARTAAAVRFEQIAAADWVAQSLADLKPVRAGRFIVHGAHDRARIAPNAIAIEIEAALAFGTGHHGTTRGCLKALDALAKSTKRRRKSSRRHPEVAAAGGPRRMIGRHPSRLASLAPQGDGSVRRAQRVLDVGAGSGVLAIAAAKIFRTGVIAGDIDARAAAAARANARLNRAAAYVTILRAAGVHAQAITRRKPYDLIFANILLGPLMRLAAPLKRLTRPGAHVVLSGLLPAQANAALAIYRAQGLALERRLLLDGWVTLVLRR